MRLWKSTLVIIGIGLSVAFFAAAAEAGRPYITDDADIVDERTVQLETWLRADKDSTLHQAQVAFSPFHPIELQIGGAYGLMKGASGQRFASTAPRMQIKWLLRDVQPDQLPGVGVVVGANAPIGSGALVSPG